MDTHATATRPAAAKSTAPRFLIDPSWPRPLPEGWIGGQLGCVYVDHQDRILVMNRGDITREEQETCIKAPAVMIGRKGVFDSEDGTRRTKNLNAGQDALHMPAGIACDPESGDVYFADGYGNQRVVVFDRNGKFLRQWGRRATPEEMEAGVGGVFAEVVHSVAISNAGLVYVGDRQGDRVQVFDKMGSFKRNIWVRTGTPTLPDKRGTAWWTGFSPDKEQKHLYVMDGRKEQVLILDHASGEILSRFGRPGHQLGEFTHGHSLGVDSKGNIYVAETNWGRRLQKFTPA